jgi:redox-sensing transcriptional repressor
VAQLKEAICRILGLYRTWNVALVGVGYLGVSLLTYREFRAQGFHIVAAFDNDPDKIGKKRKDVIIRDIRTLSEAVEQLNIELAIVTVPKDAAQSVVDLLVRAGLKMILNFAPVSLKAPDDVVIRNVNIAIELEALSYRLASGR